MCSLLPAGCPGSARGGGIEGLTGAVFPCAALKCKNPQHHPELLACRLEWGLCPPFSNHLTSWGCQHDPAWDPSGDSCLPSRALFQYP